MHAKFKKTSLEPLLFLKYGRAETIEPGFAVCQNSMAHAILTETV